MIYLLRLFCVNSFLLIVVVCITTSYGNLNLNMINMKLSRFVCLLIAVLWYCNIEASDTVVEVTSKDGFDNQNVYEAVQMASNNKGKPVTIKLHPGVYDFSRSESVEKLYYVSNTTSESENPNPLKHIALLLKDLKNVTIDGSGSTLMMTGEMTSFVVDNCKNIILKNFNIDHSNPTQTECTVKEVGDDYLIVEVHPTSQYKIENEKLVW